MIQSGAFRILGCFYDKQVIGFADLCKAAGYPTDLGGYYIRQLTRGNYLEKIDRGQYRLLPKGKQELAINYGRRLYAPRPRLGVVIIAKQGGRFLVSRRRVQPFIGITEWPAGMISGGETMEAAVRRVASGRLGTNVEATLRGWFRRLDLYEDAVFDDKLFAVHTCELPADASVQQNTASGENYWVTAEELARVEKPARALMDIFGFVQKGGGVYAEHIYHLSADDLAI